MSRSKKRRSQQFSVMHPDAAGIDIGAEFHVVAIPPDRGPETVRSFPSFTQDLLALADWLHEHRIRTVALESTGVYWIPVFEILEARGFDVILTNARDARNVPGRKSDVNDAQWLQKLHQFGLLRASFQPSAEIAVLRTYLRQRERLLDYSSAHIQHMQKALMQMNVQLHHVVTDITGVTGMRIIRAIIAGEQDPLVLASHRDPRCKASVERITQALTGHYRPEHLFSLTQAVELYDFYQRQVQQCDQRIEFALTALEVPEQLPQAPLPKARHKAKAPNAPAFDVRAALYRALGLDLTQIHGLGPYVSLKLIAECGTDMTR